MRRVAWHATRSDDTPAAAELGAFAREGLRGESRVSPLLARHVALIAAGTLVAGLGTAFGWLLEDL
jgi:hypothetical protein